MDDSVEVRFVEKQNSKRIVSYIELPYFYGGTAYLSGKEYFVGVLASYPSIEIKADDFLWIDLNNNRTFDYLTDIYIQMNIPFTLDHISYYIPEFDHFGRQLVIEEQDQQKYSPIAVGLTAPDFTFSDSGSPHTLLAAKGKRYTLLDFWSCNSRYCSVQLREIIGKYKDKIDTIIIPFDDETFSRLPKEDLSVMKQAKKVVFGKDNRKLRYLYQITQEPWYILITPEGRIVFKQKFAAEALKEFLAANI